MSVWTAVLVGIGAAVGAPLRYLADTAVKARLGPGFPWGTFAVNVAGSALLGALTAGAALLPPGVAALAGIGFCGALTTYSTFGYEIVELSGRRRTGTALAYLVASMLSGPAAAGAAWLAVDALIGAR
ncbi:fluoride efflux transporter FluC [Pseudonocardia sp. HH130630-07]|uniref:fluoride efflux transporter FluC n=1 Tax=Pseudonocardia sp. HH130630-07 TaxID=1690815 RepID=UPI000814FB25|nr:CrcB family protein [Pseudonocardia sp. HH130630-07]ANY06323.1 chromosome condensation protein CrcB [Pseudonocardia sp. HH130630-07]